MSISKDKNGKQSSVRVTMLVWFSVVLASWLWVSYSNNELQEIPQSVVYILGILILGKSAQSFTDATKIPQETIVTTQTRPMPTPAAAPVAMPAAIAAPPMPQFPE